MYDRNKIVVTSNMLEQDDKHNLNIITVLSSNEVDLLCYFA